MKAIICIGVDAEMLGAIVNLKGSAFNSGTREINGDGVVKQNA